MISNLEEFTDFLKICRKQGVQSVVSGGISVTFGDLPKKSKKDSEAEESDIPSDGLTDEQMAFYSVGGHGQ